MRPRHLAYSPVVLGLFLSGLSGCSVNSNPSNPFSCIILRDVQGLWGGRDMWLYSDGRMVVQVVNNAKITARYETKATAAELAELQWLLDSHPLADLTLPNRPGIPDEAHPSITLETQAGTSHTVQKWANDKNADFDAVYEKLLELSKKTESSQPIFEGLYDLNWTPEKG